MPLGLGENLQAGIGVFRILDVALPNLRRYFFRLLQYEKFADEALAFYFLFVRGCNQFQV